MPNKKYILPGLIIVVAAVAVLVSGCDSTETHHPEFIINVDIDEVTYPVDSAKKLYATFYLNSNFTTPWLTVYSTRTQIMTPELNIGDYPLYFEVWYDVDGSGTLTTGDVYKGWKGKNDRTSQTLDPLPVSETELMILNFDMSSPGTY
jgi:hypothetical protein